MVDAICYSIAISAKDKDGSIEAAIQSLVRQLLDKSLPIKPAKTDNDKDKKKRKKKKKLEDHEALSEVGEPEVSMFSNNLLVAIISASSY